MDFQRRQVYAALKIQDINHGGKRGIEGFLANEA